MTITLKVSDNTKKEMIDFFEEFKRDKTPQYAVFQADDADCVVTLYESGKAVFQGASADISAQLWIERERHLNPQKKLDISNSDEKNKKKENNSDKEIKVYNYSCIGSDEVGTGDYFGPVVVTSTYVSKDNIEWLESLGVKDSKKLDDEKILKIVPEIIKRIPYKTLILSNKEYNERYNDTMNMNKIKSIMHNKVLYEILQDNYKYDYIVVDQFAKPIVYFNYLYNNPHVVRNITFLTKAEDKCLAVACASLISRYVFIKEFDNISKKYDTILLKGASSLVDEQALGLVKKYGFDILKDIAKLNFKNTDKIKDSIKK